MMSDSSSRLVGKPERQPFQTRSDVSGNSATADIDKSDTTSEATGVREEADCGALLLEGERLLSWKRYQEAVSFLEGALMLGTDDLEVKGVIWSLLGTSHFQLGNYESAARCHMHDMAICKESQDDEGELKACCNFGIAMQMQGRLKLAGRSFLKYLEGCHKRNNLKGVAKACNNLGLLWKTQAKNVLHSASEHGTNGTEEVQAEVKQHIERAIGYFQRYLDVVKKIGNKEQEGKAYGNLGVCYEMIQDFAEAIKWHLKRLEVAKELGDKRAESRAYCNIGNCKRGEGDLITATEFYLKDIDLCVETQDDHGQIVTARNLGSTYEMLGNIENCLEWHKKHLLLCKKSNDSDGQLLALSTLATLHEDRNNTELALQYYRQQRDLLVELKDSEGLQQVHDSIHRLEGGIGRPSSPRKEVSPALTRKEKGKQSALLKTMRRLKKGTIRLLSHKKDRHSVFTKAESVEGLQETPGPNRKSSIRDHATPQSVSLPSDTDMPDQGSLHTSEQDLDWDTSGHAGGLLDQVLQAVDEAGIDILSDDRRLSTFIGKLPSSELPLSPLRAEPANSDKTKKKEQPRRSKNAQKIYSQLFGGSRHMREIEKQVNSMKGDKGDGFVAPEISAEWDNWMALSRELARCDSLQIDETLFET
jgi:G-protein signaling modulator 2